jgi:hypothetical protein
MTLKCLGKNIKILKIVKLDEKNTTGTTTVATPGT